MVTCPICGSIRVLTEPRECRAERRLDAESILAVNFTVTQIRCGACGLLLNDDVNGTTAVAYGKLATEVGAPQPQISAKVHDAMRHAELLPALSDTERQQDYDQVSQPWQCLGMRRVSPGKIQDALTRIICGYLGEGHTELMIETLEQQVVQLSFLGLRGFRPVRFSRTSDGDFSFYGQVPLYRYLEDRKSGPGQPQDPSGVR